MRDQVERGVEGFVECGKGDNATSFTDDQLRSRRIKRPARRERDHRVHPRGSHLAESDGDSPERPQAIRGSDCPVDRLGDQFRVGRLDADQLDPSVRPPPGGKRGIKRCPVEGRAPAVDRHPFLVTSKVEDVTEEDIGHCRPVSHCDRKSHRPPGTFGVERPVDRVDDDGEPSVSEDDLPAFLADRDKRMTFQREPVEFRKDTVLGRRINCERAIATLTLPQLHRTLGRCRVVGQHAGDRVLCIATRFKPREPLGVGDLAHLPILPRVAGLQFQLDESQQRAVDWRGSPLLVTGPSASGKSTVLAERFRSLVEDGASPEEILVVCPLDLDADRLLPTLEEQLGEAWGELAVHGVTSLSMRVIRDAPAAAGVNPDSPVLCVADRLAVVGEAIDQLTLKEHDLGRDPTALLAALLSRIDSLEGELVDSTRFKSWLAEQVAGGTREADELARDEEFADFWVAHDALLARRGALSAGKALCLAVSTLEQDRSVREALAKRCSDVIVDGVEDFSTGGWRLVELLTQDRNRLTVFTDSHQAYPTSAAEGLRVLDSLDDRVASAEVIHLDTVHSCGPQIARAAAAMAAAQGEVAAPRADGPTGTIEFWRASTSRAEAQAVAEEIERLINGEGLPPNGIGVLVGSVSAQGPALSTALEERAVPHRVAGASAFFQRAEIRDLLAWLRLLLDPGDSAAVVRALARPPIDLGAADIARCSKIARRRRLDMVSALVAATESPTIPPEARDRIAAFLRIQRPARTAFESLGADLFVERLIQRLGLRSSLAFAASPQAGERLRALATFGDLARAHVEANPGATAREFAKHVRSLAASGLADAGVRMPPAGTPVVEVLQLDDLGEKRFAHVFIVGLDAGKLRQPAMPELDAIPSGLIGERSPCAQTPRGETTWRRNLQRGATRATERLVLTHASSGSRGEIQHPSPIAEDARLAVGGEWQERETPLFAPGESLRATYRILTEEVLETVEATGKSLHELRLDTGDDIDRAVVKFLELLKLSALLGTPDGHAAGEALAAVNERLRAVATDTQRAGLAESALDRFILDADHADRGRGLSLAAQGEPSLAAFLPKRGDGLALSAGDIETYRSCPLRYKFSRVIRIPQDPTTAQRFGIVMHQVLERWHRDSDGHGTSLQELLEQSWRRSGLGDGEQERQLKVKAQKALEKFEVRDGERAAQPLWLERAFAFRVGPHTLRGRVDRVDQLADGEFELIDYKTSYPKTAEELIDDVQLTVYAIGARDAWKLETATRSYWYVLDDDRVEVPGEVSRANIEETVNEVAEGILAQEFEPTPSYSACSICDWRLACPAAER